MFSLRSERLLLRGWRESDLEPFARLNSDTRVMQHFPSLLTREESDEIAARLSEHSEKHGFGPWVAEVPGVADFIGMVGLWIPSFEAHFTPCVEVLWRLDYSHWGKGYATEAARLALQYGFEELGLPEIVSMTVPANQRSWRVMEKLGMHRDPRDDFEHPQIPVLHPLRRHVLYRLRADER
jgi:RimJ/RimL family protein N-acetyltransferase